MRISKHSLGVVHFVGIGGIGMSGVAEILHRLGYSVQGSDSSKNSNVTRLKNLGITIYNGHSIQNISNCSLVVISSAVQKKT